MITWAHRMEAYQHTTNTGSWQPKANSILITNSGTQSVSVNNFLLGPGESLPAISGGVPDSIDETIYSWTFDEVAGRINRLDIILIYTYKKQ
jgi:hypothetical protein